MAKFDWIETLAEADWGSGLKSSKVIELTLADFAQRSGGNPDTVIYEFKTWVWTHKGPAFSVGWEAGGGPDSKVILMRGAK